MYQSYILLLVMAYHVGPGLSLPATTYDQRQSGDLNVQVHVKDVQVLALLDSELLDDYTEYDYFYDYADFTLKPIVKPTTSTTTTTEATPPASSTIAEVDTSEAAGSSLQNSTSLPIDDSSIGNSTVEESVDAEETNETLAVSSTEAAESSTSDAKIIEILKTRINDKTGNLFQDDEKDEAGLSTGRLTMENSSKEPPRKRCRSGYMPNGKGRCRRLNQRRLSLIPLAVKLAPKLFDNSMHISRSAIQEKNVQMHSK